LLIIVGLADGSDQLLDGCQQHSIKSIAFGLGMLVSVICLVLQRRASR
jgi:hypothetical protein